MRLTDLLASGRLSRHSTSADEVAQLHKLARRGLADARAQSISTDLRFCAAYQAALQLATIALACAGHRPTGVGHHTTVFEALPLVMGAKLRALSVYYDACRIKRNVAEYRRAGEIMQTEVEELIESVERFREQVEQWLRANHPSLAPR